MKIFLADYTKNIQLQETLLKNKNTIYVTFIEKFYRKPLYIKDDGSGLLQRYPDTFKIVNDIESIQKAIDECDFGILLSIHRFNTSKLEKMFIKRNKVLINSSMLSPKVLELDRYFAKSVDFGFDKADIAIINKDNINNITLSKDKYVIKPVNENSKKINYLLRTVVTNSKLELKNILNKDLYGHIKSGGAIVEEYIDGNEIDCGFYFDGSKIVGNIIFLHKEYKYVCDNNRTGTIGDECGAVIYPIYFDELPNRIKNIINNVCSYIRKYNPNHRGFIGLGLMLKINKVFLLEVTVRAGDPTETAISTIVNYNDFIKCVATGEEYKTPINKNYNVFVGMFPYGMPYNYGTSSYRKLKNKSVRNSLLIKSVKYSGKDIYYSEFGVSILCIGKDALLDNAVKKAYNVLNKVDDNTLIYRKDIGKNFKESLNNLFNLK